MHVLVLGASGLVGRALLQELPRSGAAAAGTVHRDPLGDRLRRVDVHDRGALDALLSAERPAAVVMATRFPRTADYTLEQLSLIHI